MHLCKKSDIAMIVNADTVCHVSPLTLWVLSVAVDV